MFQKFSYPLVNHETVKIYYLDKLISDFHLHFIIATYQCTDVRKTKLADVIMQKLCNFQRIFLQKFFIYQAFNYFVRFLRFIESLNSIFQLIFLRLFLVNTFLILDTQYFMKLFCLFKKYHKQLINYPSDVRFFRSNNDSLRHVDTCVQLAQSFNQLPNYVTRILLTIKDVSIVEQQVRSNQLPDDFENFFLYFCWSHEMNQLFCHYLQQNLCLLLKSTQGQHLFHTQNTANKCLMLNMNVHDRLSKHPSQLPQSIVTYLRKIPLFQLS